MEELLTQIEKDHLLKLARQALESGVRGELVAPLDMSTLSRHLCEPGATFVTLTEGGNLRGCVGALEAYQPLAEDVREHAIAAALQDYRFSPVRPDELPDIQIEVSRLTQPVQMDYQTPEELISRLRPGIDGVILRDGSRRATFLPQVWEKLPDPDTFLSYLCEKMGAAPNLWKNKRLQVALYQVEEFHE